MIVVFLSAAMMLAMLAATAISLHGEAQKRRSEVRIKSLRPFGPVH